MQVERPEPEVQLSTRVLDAAAGIVAAGGFETLTLESLADAAGVTADAVVGLFGGLRQALVLMLNREFTGIYGELVDHIERDPLGGKLSRIYYYTLVAVYERPLARVLYTVDREALNAIMRSMNSLNYIPGVRLCTDLVDAMQRAGMVRRGVDAGTVSRMLTIFGAGLALTAPHDDLDRIVRGITDLLAQVVDEDVEDTTPGKAAYFEWAMSLAHA